MFPPNILDAVEILRCKYVRLKRNVIVAYPIIEITIKESLRLTCYQLFYINDEYFEIQKPTYQYFPRISHYDFKDNEQRWSRDKRTLFSIILDLRDCGLWEFVRNKDFIKVNDNNKYSDKKALEKKLGDILD
jgi:hypothetical protein